MYLSGGLWNFGDLELALWVCRVSNIGEQILERNDKLVCFIDANRQIEWNLRFDRFAGVGRRADCEVGVLDAVRECASESVLNHCERITRDTDIWVSSLKDDCRVEVLAWRRHDVFVDVLALDSELR